MVTSLLSRSVPRLMQKVSMMKPVMQTWSPIIRSAVLRVGDEEERRRVRRAWWSAFILLLVLCYQYFVFYDALCCTKY